MLDLACGPGNVSHFIQALILEIEITCVDLSQEMLDLAEENDYLGVVKIIKQQIESKKLIKKLIKASRLGDLEKVKELVEQGSKVNQEDKNGNTALIYAEEKGHLGTAEYLRQKMNELNELCAAAEAGHLDIVKTLIEHGADVNAVAREGWTALLIAADYGHFGIVKTLIEHGADVNAVGKDFMIALLNTTNVAHSDIAEYLIKQKMEAKSKV